MPKKRPSSRSGRRVRPAARPGSGRPGGGSRTRRAAVARQSGGRPRGPSRPGEPALPPIPATACAAAELPPSPSGSRPPRVRPRRRDRRRSSLRLRRLGLADTAASGTGAVELRAPGRVERPVDPEDEDVVVGVDLLRARIGCRPDRLDWQPRLGSLIRTDHQVLVMTVVHRATPLLALLRETRVAVVLRRLARDRQERPVRAMPGDVLNVVGEIVAVEDVLLEPGPPSDQAD